MSHRFTLVFIVFLLAIVPNVRADVWGYVDDEGNTHFASKKINESYKLYYKTSHKGIVSPAILRKRYSSAALKFNPKADAAAGRKARNLARLIQRSAAFKRVRPLLKREAAAKGINFALLKALVAVESGFNTNAVSSAGAVGLMQMMPDTARSLGLRSNKKYSVEQQLTNPKTNVRLGTRYFSQMLRQFGGRVDLALAAYNAGPNAVRKRMAIPNYPETQNYVRTILAIYQTLTNKTFPVSRSINVSTKRSRGSKRRKQMVLRASKKAQKKTDEPIIAQITIPAASTETTEDDKQPTALDIVADKITAADDEVTSKK